MGVILYYIHPYLTPKKFDAFVTRVTIFSLCDWTSAFIVSALVNVLDFVNFDLGGFLFQYGIPGLIIKEEK